MTGVVNTHLAEMCRRVIFEHSRDGRWLADIPREELRDLRRALEIANELIARVSSPHPRTASFATESAPIVFTSAYDLKGVGHKRHEFNRLSLRPTRPCLIWLPDRTVLRLRAGTIAAGCSDRARDIVRSGLIDFSARIYSHSVGTEGAGR